jgi:hypothetical protein
LIALAIVAAIGLGTFAALAAPEGFRTRAKDAIATRLKHAR